jgi:hypothetical protein
LLFIEITEEKITGRKERDGWSQNKRQIDSILGHLTKDEQDWEGCPNGAGKV